MGHPGIISQRVYFIILFALSIPSSLILTLATTVYLPHQVFGQQQPYSQATIRLLLNDSINALKSGDVNKALTHLKVVEQELTGNTTSIQTLKLLVQDAIQAMQRNDTATTLAHLGVAVQQLSGPVQANATNLLTYENPILGIKMQYPPNWSVREYPYNPAANNTVVSFFSSSKSASALGNISGVSGNFVPYVDVFVFKSKNMSLAKLAIGSIKSIANATLIESRQITLKDGIPAYNVVYNVVIAGDEFFKKMQLWTMKSAKVYLVTYTAQSTLFSNYIPIVQKMFDSFELSNKTGG